MKMLVIAASALLLVALGRPAAAQMMGPFIYGSPYGFPPYPFPAYTSPYAGYPYYPYPLPPAPSLGFGRGGIYGHAFVGRGDGIVGYTFPGYAERRW